MLHVPLENLSLDRGTVLNFAALVSSSIVDTISKATGSMSSSALMCGFLHWKIMCATCIMPLVLCCSLLLQINVTADGFL